MCPLKFIIFIHFDIFVTELSSFFFFSLRKIPVYLWLYTNNFQSKLLTNSVYFCPRFVLLTSGYMYYLFKKLTVLYMPYLQLNTSPMFIIFLQQAMSILLLHSWFLLFTCLCLILYHFALLLLWHTVSDSLLSSIFFIFSWEEYWETYYYNIFMGVVGRLLYAARSNAVWTVGDVHE